MSKSFRANSEHINKREYHHAQHQSKHKKKIDGIQKKSKSSSAHHIFNSIHFFKEIIPLINFQGIFTDREKNILVHWLDNAYHNMLDEAFTSDVLMRFSYKLHNMMKKNSQIRSCILAYNNAHPEFSERLLGCSEIILDRLNSSELSQFILFLVHIQIYPDARWLSTWTEKTEHLIVNNFEEKDLQDCLEALCVLRRIRGLYVTHAWMDKWFEKSQDYIDFMQIERLGHLMSLIGMCKMMPPEAWINACMLRSNDFLNGLTGRYLFQFENAFFIDKIRHDPVLIERWFQHSLMEMPDADTISVMMCLLPLAHNNIPIPDEWFDAWMEKVTCDFDKVMGNPSYRIISIAYALYALALLQKDVSCCQAFLMKCNVFFATNEYSVQNEYSARKLRKILFAKNYFDLLGFKLNSIEAYYPHLISEIDNLPKKGSAIQTEFAELLTKMFGTAIQEEAHIDVIVDSVDFLVAHKKLVIEVDGYHHFVDGKENALTRVKTKMLEKSGYHVKRFTVDPQHHEHLPDLLRAELSAYL